MPASWCDGHHLRHWADGGTTDIGNAALLCGRHHTIVHRKGYHGELVDGHVEWVLTPGAYDHSLADRRASSADGVAAVGSPPAVRQFDVRGQLETAASGSKTSPPWRP